MFCKTWIYVYIFCLLFMYVLHDMDVCIYHLFTLCMVWFYIVHACDYTRVCFTWIVSFMFMFMICCIHVFMYIPVIYACYSPLTNRQLQTNAKKSVRLTPGWSARRTQTADHGLSPFDPRTASPKRDFERDGLRRER